MAAFPGAVPSGGMADLLHSRLPTGSFTSLELEEDNLLQSAGGHFPPSPPSPPASRPPTACSSLTSSSSLTAAPSAPAPTERTFPRTHASHALTKSPTPSPRGGRYGGEHVASPYGDHASSPHAGAFQADAPLLLEPKQQLPQFSAAFGHQLAAHSGIPKDVQPSHSSTAPPAGFSIVGATAASANSATQSK
ncbi:hypothetical protein EYF80_063532 [Liparis tanakae]|uniref:Uncharacterized protein n=1 Tax=Liparis tanakae TaxID=230148 RepID=A0A4Z2EC68_9TELE|nr:hypothetical protein EYF80_063532 [Liparis tanakae]